MFNSVDQKFCFKLISVSVWVDRMSPIPFSDLTNEIVDLTMDTSAAMRETGDTWTMFMGVVVTLLPKASPFIETFLSSSHYT